MIPAAVVEVVLEGVSEVVEVYGSLVWIRWYLSKGKSVSISFNVGCSLVAYRHVPRLDGMRDTRGMLRVGIIGDDRRGWQYTRCHLVCGRREGRIVDDPVPGVKSTLNNRRNGQSGRLGSTTYSRDSRNLTITNSADCCSGPGHLERGCVSGECDRSLTAY